jgi:hypothetical protein
MENGGVGSSRNGLLKERFGGNQVNTIEDVFRGFELARRLKQRKHRLHFEWPSDIDRVGPVFRRLQTLKHTRKRDIRAPVENESEYAVVIVASQQNHCFSEMRIAEVSARYQQLSRAQTFGILRLDWKKVCWQRFAFRREVSSKRRLVPGRIVPGIRFA